MRKLIILAICTLFLINLISIVSATWCYQETANVSTACGGLNTGSYTAINWNNPQYAYDGNLNTYANFPGGSAILYINYSKPNGANYANWNITAIDSDTTDRSQYLDLSSCWNAYSDKVSLMLNLTGIPSMYAYCWNGTNFKSLSSTFSVYAIYEEAINWNITTIDLVSPLNNQIFTDDQPTARFNISTGNMTTCYWSPDTGLTNYTLTKLNSTYFYLTNTSMVDGIYTNAMFYCNRSTDGIWVNQSVNFEVDSSNITQCRNLNVNRTYAVLNSLSSSGDCLTVKNNSVTINGNNKNLSYTNRGIYINGYNSLTIKNFNNISYINTGNKRAIELDSSNNNNIFNISFLNGGNTILQQTSSNSLFKDLNISNLLGNSNPYLDTGSNNTFLNCSWTSTEYVVNGGQLIRQWYFDVQVNASNTGTYLSGATINIYDNQSNLITSQTTNATGMINQTILNSYTDNSGTITYNTPHTISISKTGYYSDSTNVNLTLTGNYFLKVIMNSNIPPSIIPSTPLNNTWSNKINNTYICNSTGSNTLLNATLKIWNSTGSLINSSNASITGLTNSTTFSNIASVQGTNLWNCYICDNQGLCAWAGSNNTFNIDTTNPNATLITPGNNTNWTINQNFSVNLSDNIGIKNATLYITNSSGTTVNTTTFTFVANTINQVVGTVVSLSNGIYKWFYSVFDWAGNSFTTSNNTMILDSTPPVINIVYPLNNSAYNINNSFNINFTISDNLLPISSCWYTNNSGVNNYTIVNCNNFTQNFSDGTRTYRIYANDTLNNKAFSSVTFTISTSLPAVTLVNPTNNIFISNGTGINFNFSVNSANPISQCQLWGNWTGSFILNQTNITAVPNDGTVTNFNQINLTSGTYKWNLRCNDSTNNINWGPTNYTFTVETTYPQITDLNYYPTPVYTGTDINISARINETYISTVWIMINYSGVYQNITVTTFNGTSYIYTLLKTNYNNFQNVSWKWFVNNSAGLVNNTNFNYFIPTDLSPYNVTIFNQNNSFININSYLINFTANDPDYDALNYSIYISPNGTSYVLISSTTNNYLNLTGFNTTDNAKNYYYIVANDSKLANQSINYTFNIDKTSPTITIVDPKSASASNIYCTFSNLALNYITNETNIDYCNFTVTWIDGLGSTIIETPMTKLNGCINTTFSVFNTAGAVDTLNLTIYDKAGNFQNIAQNFYVNPFDASCSGAPPGSGGGTTTPTNNTLPAFCGDGICEESFMYQGTMTKKSFQNCNIDCAGFNFDEFFNSLFFNCFSKDTTKKCIWIPDKTVSSVCGDNICTKSENPFSCSKDCGNFNTETMYYNCIEGKGKPCFWRSNLAAYMIVGLIIIIIGLAFLKVIKYQNKKITVPQYVKLKYKSKRRKR